MSTAMPVITESAINQAAEIMIQANCNKHRIPRDQFPADGVDEARRIIRQEMEADAALKSNPLYQRLQAAEESARQARMERDAALQVRPSTGSPSTGSTKDPHVVRRQLGEQNWMGQTDNGRLLSCGVDPAKVTSIELEEAKKLFGKGSDSHYASNYMKQDSARYRYLKTIAVVLNMQAR